MKSRVAEVNAELRRRGIKDKLVSVRGKYYRFIGPDASDWRESSVYVYRAASMSVERWLDEYEQLARRAKQ